MDIKLHKNATTTPKIRAEIQAASADVSNSALARRHNVSNSTVRRWRHRSNTHDQTRQKIIKGQLLLPLQERLLIDLRLFLRLSLDDLLAFSTSYLNINLSRASMHRLLRRYNVSKIKNVADQDFQRLFSIENRCVENCICEQLVIKTFPFECNSEHTEIIFMIAATNLKRTWRYIEIGGGRAIDNDHELLSRMLANTPFAVSVILNCDGEIILNNVCK